MKGYNKIVNESLNYKTYWERFQLETMGNILKAYPLQEIPDPIPTDETDKRLSQDVNDQY